MDIHRCNFVDYAPSAINAIAISQPHLWKKQKVAPVKLAVGRANGDIEIWSSRKGHWIQETIMHGGEGRSIDGLVWIAEPNEEIDGHTLIGKARLFSIGYTTTVTEWDLAQGLPLRHVSGNHGDIWCIAAQPAYPATFIQEMPTVWEVQNLVAGCTDGTLVVYSTKDGELQLEKHIVPSSTAKARVVSVAFQTRSIVVAGCTDSTIRIYDITKGVLLRNMTSDTGPRGGPKQVIMWSLVVLPDGNIVSGDSTGEVKIWHGKTYTFKQRIKSHEQDVLCLATNWAGNKLFSGGMDRRTVVYRRPGKNRWSEVSHRRFHGHDVKAMASFESNHMSFVMSGGPDAGPIVVPLRQFGLTYQRGLSHLPQSSMVESSTEKRLMMSWWNRELRIWRFVQKSKPSAESDEPAEDEEEEGSSMKDRKLVAKIELRGEANVTSTSLSEDGTMIAVSTNSGIKVFHLQDQVRKEVERLKVTKIFVPSFSTIGARLVKFSPDGKWLCLILNDSKIILLRITQSTSPTSPPISIHPHPIKLTRVDRKTEKLVILGGHGLYDRTITQVAFSSNSRIIAVSDLAGYIDTFVLSGAEDLSQPLSLTTTATSANPDSDSEAESENDESAPQKSTRMPTLTYGQHWTLSPSSSRFPKLLNPAIILSFRPSAPEPPSTTKKSKKMYTPSQTPTRNNPNPIPRDVPTGEDRLLVITSINHIYEFHALSGTLTEWSRRNTDETFPSEWRILPHQAKGIIWDISSLPSKATNPTIKSLTKSPIKSKKTGKEGEGEEGRARFFVYSDSWIWMFNLNQDFPERIVGEEEKKRKVGYGMGAGCEIADGELEGRVKRVKVSNEDGDSKSIGIFGTGMVGSDDEDEESTNQEKENDEEDENDDMEGYEVGDFDGDENNSSLSKERRKQQQLASQNSRKNKNSAGGKQGEKSADGELMYWYTMKYKNILGVVPLGKMSVGEGEGPEVAVVERKREDVDAGARYVGKQEWRARDVRFALGME